MISFAATLLINHKFSYRGSEIHSEFAAVAAEVK